ncbi:MAG: type II toxin-antitoxin system PemK/MazF family toxin [Micromonosporaceae bacterium]
MKQGEIYDCTVGDRRYRVLVVSADAHNDVRVPWVVPIRHGRMNAPPYLVTLLDADPVGGTADVDRLDRVRLTGEPVGIVTGATMQRVREAVGMVFAD